MRTVTCTLTFPDGEKVLATASAKSSGETVHFKFEGDVTRLKPFEEHGTITFFEPHLRSCATRANAKIEVSTTGELDSDS